MRSQNRDQFAVIISESFQLPGLPLFSSYLDEDSAIGHVFSPYAFPSFIKKDLQIEPNDSSIVSS